MPAVHIWTSFANKSKVSTNYTILKTATKDYWQLPRITSNALEYLLHFLHTNGSNNENFNDLSYTMYPQKSSRWTLRNYQAHPLQFSVIFRVPTYNVLVGYTHSFRIKYYATIIDSVYGFNKVGILVPITVSTKNIFPRDYPTHCNCYKWLVKWYCLLAEHYPIMLQVSPL